MWRYHTNVTFARSRHRVYRPKPVQGHCDRARASISILYTSIEAAVRSSELVCDEAATCGHSCPHLSSPALLPGVISLEPRSSNTRPLTNGGWRTQEPTIHRHAQGMASLLACFYLPHYTLRMHGAAPGRVQSSGHFMLPDPYPEEQKPGLENAARTKPRYK